MQYRIILILIFFLSALYSHAQPFGEIRKIEPGQRIRAATDIYKKLYRRVDSLTAFNALNQLEFIALGLKDQKLECAVYDLRADYLSVNRGYNSGSLFYYQKAIDLANKYDLPVETGIYTFKKGQYFNTFRYYVPAFENFLKALTLFRDIGFENVPEISTYLNRMADFYYNLEDFESARSSLLEALKYPDISSRGRINMINTIGLIYRDSKKYPEALQYFQRAHNLAQKSRDFVWVGITTGNIGSVYFLKKNYELALPYLITDYEQSIKYAEFGNAAAALLRIAEIELSRGDYVKAEISLNSVESLLKKEPVYLKQRITLYKLKADVYELTDRQENTITYLKKFAVAKDSLAKLNNSSSILQVKLKWELEKHLAELNKLEVIARTETLKRNGLLVILSLLILISFLIYNRQKIKIKKEKALSEKQETHIELEKSNSKLALLSYRDSLRLKNDLIENYKSEIFKLQSQLAGPDDLIRVEKLESLMRTHIMTDENWREFRNLFEKVHTGFFDRLKNRFEKLTETDTRLLALLKLRLNNREMANMLGITLEGIKKSKQRLRKKIGLNEESPLKEIIDII